VTAEILSPEGDGDRFRRLLDEQNDWPARFTFKFIVPVEHLLELEELLQGHSVQTRPSRNGNYIAATLSPVMDSSDAVIALYEKVSVIEGLLAL
jgi:putative lipoic acid-binding regulatory protein